MVLYGFIHTVGDVCDHVVNIHPNDPLDQRPVMVMRVLPVAECLEASWVPPPRSLVGLFWTIRQSHIYIYTYVTRPQKMVEDLSLAVISGYRAEDLQIIWRSCKVPVRDVRKKTGPRWITCFGSQGLWLAYLQCPWDLTSMVMYVAYASAVWGNISTTSWLEKKFTVPSIGMSVFQFRMTHHHTFLGCFFVQLVPWKSGDVGKESLKQQTGITSQAGYPWRLPLLGMEVKVGNCMKPTVGRELPGEKPGWISNVFWKADPAVEDGMVYLVQGYYIYIYILCIYIYIITCWLDVPSGYFLRIANWKNTLGFLIRLNHHKSLILYHLITYLTMGHAAVWLFQSAFVFFPKHH